METRKKPRTIVDLIQTIALCGIAVGFSGMVIKSTLNEGEWDRTRREVAVAIDTDHNKVYTDNEWSDVYNTLGIKDTKMQGIDLKIEQFRDYLAKKK